MKRRTFGAVMVVMLGLALSPLSGCVVWDIEEGIVASNGNLGRIEDELNAIDEGLGETNDNLGTVEARLTSMDEQLRSLQAQLDATNAHLESLRKTINNIDKTIPFLSISGDDEEEQGALENGDKPAQEPAAEPGQGSGGS